MEYIMLIVLVLGAFLVFQKYIARGFAGRWKAVGESLGQGRIYDPRRTTECIFDFQYTSLWYDKACFEGSGCDCLSVRANTTTCEDCIVGCAAPECQ
ncbi:MAG: hypothetical protein A2705_03160 [Omnitrophica WOR_2 bacterium RIFCSPHIGHO2_01_FULL_52_10]|nr:MAG: hypothetical protein A2705_03160 [Omnitrophica WOR_2 bacterium RIFCSPHIGHO2_01_FULL_52_10]